MDFKLWRDYSRLFIYIFFYSNKHLSLTNLSSITVKWKCRRMNHSQFTPFHRTVCTLRFGCPLLTNWTSCQNIHSSTWKVHNPKTITSKINMISKYTGKQKITCLARGMMIKVVEGIIAQRDLYTIEAPYPSIAFYLLKEKEIVVHRKEILKCISLKIQFNYFFFNLKDLPNHCWLKKLMLIDTIWEVGKHKR